LRAAGAAAAAARTGAGAGLEAAAFFAGAAAGTAFFGAAVGLPGAAFAACGWAPCAPPLAGGAAFFAGARAGARDAALVFLLAEVDGLDLGVIWKDFRRAASPAPHGNPAGTTRLF
jgi:hypothetical protein